MGGARKPDRWHADRSWEQDCAGARHRELGPDTEILRARCRARQDPTQRARECRADTESAGPSAGPNTDRRGPRQRAPGALGPDTESAGARHSEHRRSTQRAV